MMKLYGLVKGAFIPWENAEYGILYVPYSKSCPMRMGGLYKGKKIPVEIQKNKCE